MVEITDSIIRAGTHMSYPMGYMHFWSEVR